MARDTLHKDISWKKWAIFASALLLAGVQVKMYFVQELLVVELLLLLAFGVVGILGALCLLLGVAGERGGLLLLEGSRTVLRARLESATGLLTAGRSEAGIHNFSD